MRDWMNLMEMTETTYPIKDGSMTLMVRELRGGRFAFVAMIDGERAASGEFQLHNPLYSDKGSVEEITVAPKFKRRGIASAIYNHFESLGYTVVPSDDLKPEGRKFWDNRELREDASIAPEIVEAILSDRRLKRGVKVGKNAKFWRGTSEDSGSGMANYGMGFYFTVNRAYAAQYGKVESVSPTMLPDNPMRFDTKNDFQIWLQTAQKLLGYKSNLDFVKDYDDIGLFVRTLDPSCDGIQMFTGSDAMFVTYGV